MKDWLKGITTTVVNLITISLIPHWRILSHNWRMWFRLLFDGCWHKFAPFISRRSCDLQPYPTKAWNTMCANMPYRQQALWEAVYSIQLTCCVTLRAYLVTMFKQNYLRSNPGKILFQPWLPNTFIWGVNERATTISNDHYPYITPSVRIHLSSIHDDLQVIAKTKQVLL